jgi:Holliday junction resolvasome RuvABC endonuclease subunit
MPGERALDLFDRVVQPNERMVPGKWVAPLLGESVLGIDSSLQGFAICYSAPGKPLLEGEWKSPPADGVRGRSARIDALIRGTLQIALAHHPSLILIEAYSFGSAHRGEQGHHDRAELGGVLRWELCKITQCPIIEVAPASLKKFTTGDGHAKKPAMISAIARLQGRQIKTDNKADAAALCELGLALTGQKPPPLWETPLGTPPSTGKKERTYLQALRKGYGLAEVQS